MRGEKELLRITSLFAFLLLREVVVFWVGSPDKAYPPKSIDIREGRSIDQQSFCVVSDVLVNRVSFWYRKEYAPRRSVRKDGKLSRIREGQ